PRVESDREDESDDQDSWIEDDGGEDNVPILPEAFSMFGHQSLSHQFKVVMQMLVHLACTKAKERIAFRRDEKNDQYFGLSLRALRRKLDGMRDSLVVSSPIVKNESDSEEDDEDQEEEATSFELGRFCKARVRCYHDFVHWEWQLFEAINSEMDVLRTARLRNDPAQPDRPAVNDPDGIMAWLDRRGIVEQEWHRLEQLMEAARGLEFRKGDEDD
ncbi:hypothetical protein FRC07_012321, partial [Ceratobasidium sp. 392]